MHEHDPSSLNAAIEAIVIVATEPVPVELLAQLLERPLSDIEMACEALAAEYRARHSGFELVEVAGGYRYQSVADLAPYVERFLLDEQRARLSAPPLKPLRSLPTSNRSVAGKLRPLGVLTLMECCERSLRGGISMPSDMMTVRVKQFCTEPRRRSARN